MNERKDGVCYVTKGPKMRVLEPWQMTLSVKADVLGTQNDNQAYITKETQRRLADQATRLKQAWAEINKPKKIVVEQ